MRPITSFLVPSFGQLKVAAGLTALLHLFPSNVYRQGMYKWGIKPFGSASALSDSDEEAARVMWLTKRSTLTAGIVVLL